MSTRTSPLKAFCQNSEVSQYNKPIQLQIICVGNKHTSVCASTCVCVSASPPPPPFANQMLPLCAFTTASSWVSTQVRKNKLSALHTVRVHRPVSVYFGDCYSDDGVNHAAEDKTPFSKIPFSKSLKDTQSHMHTHHYHTHTLKHTVEKQGCKHNLSFRHCSSLSPTVVALTSNEVQITEQSAAVLRV